MLQWHCNTNKIKYQQEKDLRYYYEDKLSQYDELLGNHGSVK